jgi:hypothetical protein
LKDHKNHDKEVWQAYKRGKICLDMPMNLVGMLKGTKYEEKRNVTKKATILTYKYGKSENRQGNWRYDIEVKYENNVVISFRDL